MNGEPTNEVRSGPTNPDRRKFFRKVVVAAAGTAVAATGTTACSDAISPEEFDEFRAHAQETQQSPSYFKEIGEIPSEIKNNTYLGHNLQGGAYESGTFVHCGVQEANNQYIVHYLTNDHIIAGVTDMKVVQPPGDTESWLPMKISSVSCPDRDLAVVAVWVPGNGRMHSIGIPNIIPDFTPNSGEKYQLFGYPDNGLPTNQRFPNRSVLDTNVSLQNDTSTMIIGGGEAFPGQSGSGVFSRVDGKPRLIGLASEINKPDSPDKWVKVVKIPSNLEDLKAEATKS